MPHHSLPPGGTQLLVTSQVKPKQWLLAQPCVTETLTQLERLFTSFIDFSVICCASEGCSILQGHFLLFSRAGCFG